MVAEAWLVAFPDRCSMAGDAASELSVSVAPLSSSAPVFVKLLLEHYAHVETPLLAG